MGVHGLWKLIDKAGRPVPVESLENKVLAIDVSIWLYQLVRGFDSSAKQGSSMFLLGFFHRICKLLFYRIKPIFVFDGGVPSLKKKTIAARQKGRRRAQESIEKVRQQLLENLIQQQALGDVLGENVKIPKQFTSKQDELFWLPPVSEEVTISRLEEESDSEEERLTQKYIGDLNSVDVSSEEFLQLPADVRHDILTDLKETRKLNSWARIHLMPEEADDFSSFQMGRLLKRRAVQVGLDKAADELGVRGFTVSDLENILTEQGIDLSQRIAADSSTRFFYSSNPVGKQNEQCQLSGDEDDVSERICSSRNFSSGESSGSEDEIAPVVQKLASRGNGDLSQQEILDLIKQQHSKALEKCRFEPGRPGTSKSDFSFLEEEESKPPTEMGNRDRINDPTVARGKASNGDNEISKLGPGKFSEADTLSGRTTTSQKGIPLWSNQVGGVSPYKNVPGSSNEALEKQKNDLGFDEGMESAIDNTELTCDTDDIFMLSNEMNSSTNSNKGLDVSIKPEHSIEHSCFAHVTGEPVRKSLESSVEEAVAKSILMLTGTSQSGSEILEGNGISKKPLKIVIDPNKPIEDDDIFADVFSVTLPDKSESTHTESTSVESEMLPKTLEIVIDPNESPEEDIFADVFSDSDKSKSATHQSTSSNTRTSPNALEIVINPKEPPEEDIFADVFSQPSNSAQIGEPFTAAESVESTEIIINPDALSGADFSADVFTANPESSSQETIKPSFRKFVNDIKKSSSTKDLNDIKNILEKESLQLAGETKREERLASTISEQITQEAKNLLELFGIPYVVAPMEAEAQCAYLDLTGQTEGTITDDSDIWLFGANNVFKNFFDQKKFVKLYKSSDILQCYRLNRDDLIMIAMLVGSDYTSGLAGIGPVNAIEIIAHFPRSQGAPTPQSRLLKFVDAYLSSEINQRLLKKIKSIEFTDGFPSDEVVKAYMSPIVDESKEKFTWSKPDLAKIKHFMRDKFGWDFNRTDKTLIPIFDKLNQSSTQKTIHNYFEWAFDEGEAATVSRRVGNAVEILATGIIPSPSKKPRNDEPSNRRNKPKDRLVSNYSRRKYGRYQQQEKQLENEPVLEGMRAARAAANAIMAATRKPIAKASDSQAAKVGGSSASNIMPSPKMDIGEPAESSPRQKVTVKKLKTPDPVAGPSSSRAAPAGAPLPALSDILCGVGTEPPVPNLWTRSKDLVSPYAKRKYGKLGQSVTNKRDSFVVPQRPIQSFDRVMPSKTPAQIARERAAKKLKESKQKTAQRKIR